MNLVTLTRDEWLMAAMVGVTRNISSRMNGKTVAYSHEKLWSRHIEGACGEAAFAKWLRVPWSASVDTYKDGGDVLDIQVRTRSQDHFDLNIRDIDAPHFDDPFVLVTGRAPAFAIIGWVYGREAKTLGVWADYGNYGKPCWWVPQSKLRPMDTLCLSATTNSAPSPT